MLELEVGKVLRPSMGIGYCRVVHASLWSAFVLENGIPVQDVRRCRYLWLATTVAAFLTGGRYNHTRQVADTPGLTFAPAEVQGQPLDAVKWVLLVGCPQFGNVTVVLGLLFGCSPVVVGAADVERACKPVPPSWFDLVQDGYSFDRCISAVALPSKR